MDAPDTKSQIEALLRSLRSADTQAAAVAWMTKAYKVMEACLHELDERPQASSRGTLVFVPVRPHLVIAKEIPKHPPRAAPRVWYEGETVVYPLRPLPPSHPRPFTISDSRKLAAQTEAKRRIQRLGR